MVRVFVTGAAAVPDRPTVPVPVPVPLRRGHRVAAFTGFAAKDAAAREQAGRIRSRVLPGRMVERPGGNSAAMVIRSQRVPRRRSKEAADRRRSVPNAPVGGGRPLVQVVLGVLTLTASVVGIWQLVAPRSFYDGSPGFGHAWVSVDGPFNEHLLRDVGGGNLAIAVMALAALVRPSPVLARATGLAALVAAVPHLVYHLVHVSLVPGQGDQLAQTLSLLATVLVPAAIVVWAGALSKSHEGTDAAPVFPAAEPIALSSLSRSSAVSD